MNSTNYSVYKIFQLIKWITGKIVYLTKLSSKPPQNYINLLYIMFIDVIEVVCYNKRI